MLSSSNAGVHSGGSHVSLDSLRDAAKAGNEGSKSQVRKSFYTNVPRECFQDMELSRVNLMGLEFDSAKEYYHLKVCTSNSVRVILVYLFFQAS
jgi:hypothetical protein